MIIINYLLFFLFFDTSSFVDETEYYSQIINIALDKQQKYRPSNKDYVIIIDYRKNIFRERLYLIDMKKKSIILKSRVSHAFNSGVLIPTNFSNILNSEKSSDGAFLTGSINQSSKFGLSLIVNGLDKGVNDNAKKREIIFHSDKKMKTIWSSGCFATPDEINNKIVHLAQKGCLVWVIG
jgi:hypothetical protein